MNPFDENKQESLTTNEFVGEQTVADNNSNDEQKPVEKTSEEVEDKETQEPVSEAVQEEKPKNGEESSVEEDISPETSVEQRNSAVNNETEGTSNLTLTAIKELSDKIDLLSKQFDAKIAHTTHEEKIVDQMHAELQKYKADMYSQLVRPILLDIIDIRDSILRVSQTYAAKPEEEQVITLKMFTDYTYDIQEILEKNNINIYKSEIGDAFIPVRQRVVKKVATPNEELHGKIAESIGDGYEYLGKTISPEKIAVYVYEAPKDEPEKTEGEK